MSMMLEECNEEVKQEYNHCDKVICHKCIGDRALSVYIRKSGTMRECSYCLTKEESIPFDGFIERIKEGFEFMYSRAIKELPFAEGEYVGRTYKSNEIVDTTIAEQLCPNAKTILEDIRSAMQIHSLIIPETQRSTTGSLSVSR